MEVVRSHCNRKSSIIWLSLFVFTSCKVQKDTRFNSIHAYPRGESQFEFKLKSIDSVQFKTGKYYYTLAGNFQYEDSLVPTIMMFSKHPFRINPQLVMGQIGARSIKFSKVQYETLGDTMKLYLSSSKDRYTVRMLR